MDAVHCSHVNALDGQLSLKRWALIRKRRDTQTGLQNITENGTNATAGSQLPVETSLTDGQKVSTAVGPASGVSILFPTKDIFFLYFTFSLCRQ